MTDHVFCVAEEPLSPNQQLIAVDETTNELVLADFGVSKMYRYSFIFHWSIAEVKRKVRELAILMAFLQHLREEAYWLVGWKHHFEGTWKIRSLVLKRKLEAAGWSVEAREGFGFALKLAELAGASELSPPEHAPPVGGSAIIFGNPIAAATLVETPFEATIRMFCGTYQMRPGRSFLRKFADCRSGVAYHAFAPGDLPRLVVVSPWRSSEVVEHLFSDGMVDVILEEKETPKVWKSLLGST